MKKLREQAERHKDLKVRTDYTAAGYSYVSRLKLFVPKKPEFLCDWFAWEDIVETAKERKATIMTPVQYWEYSEACPDDESTFEYLDAMVTGKRLFVHPYSDKPEEYKIFVPSTKKDRFFERESVNEKSGFPIQVFEKMLHHFYRIHESKTRDIVTVSRSPSGRRVVLGQHPDSLKTDRIGIRFCYEHKEDIS